MSILDDTAIFAAIVQQGGFSHAAKFLGLSNGLVSRRMAQLEKQLGVTLLKRTTRQLQLTPEGELFWQHAQRIQQELDTALCVIKSLADKPKGDIRVSAPPYFGKHFLMPIINKFMSNFEGISIELILEDQFLDPIKKNIDLLIRGTGYFDTSLKDSTLKTKLLIDQKINLYASREYLLKYGEPSVPEDLKYHAIIGTVHASRTTENEIWTYTAEKGEKKSISSKPKFYCNDMDSRVAACVAGHGIGKFTELVFLPTTSQILSPILTNFDWGEFHIYAVYAQQSALPKRTRLLLDFISAHIQNLQERLT